MPVSPLPEFENNFDGVFIDEQEAPAGRGQVIVIVTVAVEQLPPVSQIR